MIDADQIPLITGAVVLELQQLDGRIWRSATNETLTEVNPQTGAPRPHMTLFVNGKPYLLAEIRPADRFGVQRSAL